MATNQTTEAQNMIFRAMRERFGEDWYGFVPPYQWRMWRGHITKLLFANDIIAPEAIAVIGDVPKRQWPQGTGFFSRVRDVALLQRKTKEQVVRVDHGMERLTFPVHNIS